MLNRNRINKYNSHQQLENEYKYDYEKKNENKRPKVVVYTCITGKYDDLIEPLIKVENIDYIAFTDIPECNSNIWEKREIPKHIADCNNNIFINRYIKFHLKELFKNSEYEYAIYIDGNIKVISDLTDFVYGINDKTGLAIHRHQYRDCLYDEIEVCRLIKKGNYKKMKEQKEKYKNEGFPKKFGLYECNVIVSDLKNENAREILDAWWDDFKNSESYRDQVSLPYVIWKKKYKFNDIGSLGNNVYKNPKIRIEDHKMVGGAHVR